MSTDKKHENLYKKEDILGRIRTDEDFLRHSENIRESGGAKVYIMNDFLQNIKDY